jgi:hypothetical protein
VRSRERESRAKVEATVPGWGWVSGGRYGGEQGVG